MRRYLIVYIILFSSLNLFSQRLNIGYFMEYGLFSYSHFKKDYFFSNKSFKGFYIEKNQLSTPVIFGTGLFTAVDYGRFSVNGNFSLTAIDNLKYKYKYPVADNEFIEYYSKISLSLYNFAATLSYSFFNRKLARLYVESGVSYTIPSNLREQMSRDSDFKIYYSDRDEIKNILALSNPYPQLVTGVGFRMTFFSVGTKCYIKMNNFNNLFFSYIAFNITSFVNVGRLAKHYVFIPD